MLPSVASTPQLPQMIASKRVNVSQDTLPASLRELDYWQVLEQWKLYENRSNGTVNRTKFFKLINSPNQADHIPKAQCDKLFSCLDKDDSGEIDLEEFMAWCFSLHSTFSGGVRYRLGDMDPVHVHDYFNRVDTSGNGLLDPGEFYAFIKKFSPESNMTRGETNRLFGAIDTDRSGEIDAKEFMSWVYPDRALTQEDKTAIRATTSPRASTSPQRGSTSPRRGSMCAPLQLLPSGWRTSPRWSMSRTGSPSTSPPPRRRLSSAGGSMRSLGSPVEFRDAQTPSRMERGPSKAGGLSLPAMDRDKSSQSLPEGSMILEFKIGADFRDTMVKISQALQRSFGDLVKVRTVTEAEIKGCTRCFLHVGRGVMLWDRPSMIAHRDDPFRTFDTARDFIKETISKWIPALMRAKHVSRR
jgi:Ca2+-binding EF-hand superfamily protein